MIRIATPGDGPEIAAIYAPFVRESHTSFEREAPDGAEMGRRIEATLRTYPWLVCAEAGEVLGYAYAASHRAREAYQWSVETTVYLREDARGKGMGKGLYRALFDLLARQGFQMAYAGIALPNPASIGLHLSVGFEPVGVYRAAGFKLGRWHDVAWYQRLLRELDPSPAAPLPFSELLDRRVEVR